MKFWKISRKSSNFVNFQARKMFFFIQVRISPEKDWCSHQYPYGGNLQQVAAVFVNFYVSRNKCWPYLGGGRAQQWSQYLPTCAGTSVDLTRVLVELSSGPSTFLLALEQVLTLPWWWQSSAVVPVHLYLHWNKCWRYPGGGRAQKWALHGKTEGTFVIKTFKDNK